VTLGGASFTCTAETTVAICGAEAELRVDDDPLALWESRAIPAGAKLQLGISQGPGFRLYLAVDGGFDVPELFGSRATYTMGALGGHEGRALQKGDGLPLGPASTDPVSRRFREDARPTYRRDWEIEAIPGPQASPDFLTEADLDIFFSRSWSVDRNSNRTGIRLEPQAFEWARTTGGVAGGHPSNILDNSYPVGAVNINGDLPVILGPDGPTAGGFVCAATVAHAAFWKLGQLRPIGDTVRFRKVSLEEARELDENLDALLDESSIEVG